MAEIPLTRASLLVRLRDPRDEAAWVEFIDLYGALVYNYARKQGLQDADAADLGQEVLQASSWRNDLRVNRSSASERFEEHGRATLSSGPPASRSGGEWDRRPSGPRGARRRRGVARRPAGS